MQIFTAALLFAGAMALPHVEEARDTSAPPTDIGLTPYVPCAKGVVECCSPLLGIADLACTAGMSASFFGPNPVFERIPADM